jgi:hypothetical protein
VILTTPGGSLKQEQPGEDPGAYSDAMVHINLSLTVDVEPILTAVAWSVGQNISLGASTSKAGKTT